MADDGPCHSLQDGERVDKLSQLKPALERGLKEVQDGRLAIINIVQEAITARVHE